MRFPQGEIALSYADNETDRNVVWDVFVNRCYGNDFHDSTVIDIGAHKGYFGAYAVMHGAKQGHLLRARAPELSSFLTQTAQSFRTPRRDSGKRDARLSRRRSGEVDVAS